MKPHAVPFNSLAWLSAASSSSSHCHATLRAVRLCCILSESDCTLLCAGSVFLEDLPEDEQDITGLAKYGAGLQNLGNTCYMNSTLQVQTHTASCACSMQDWQALPCSRRRGCTLWCVEAMYRKPCKLKAQSQLHPQLHCAVLLIKCACYRNLQAHTALRALGIP